MGWYEMRWKKAEKTWDEMRWDEMRWDDTDYDDNGMQWTISKRSCDAMRSDEMRKDPTLKRDGSGMKSQEIVAAMHRRLARTLKRHSLCMPRLNFETSGKPSSYWVSSFMENPHSVLLMVSSTVLGDPAGSSFTFLRCNGKRRGWKTRRSHNRRWATVIIFGVGLGNLLGFNFRPNVGS